MRHIIPIFLMFCVLSIMSIHCGTAPEPVQSPAVQSGPPLADWDDGYVMANGIRIRYWRTGGNKPVMILAHGSSDYGLCWTAVARELEADYDIILADARGHGYSDPPSKDDPADAQVEDLAGLIRELKLEKPIVMGHSMGSSSATWFAARYPDVPRAVVLVDPGLTPRNYGASNADAQENRRLQLLEKNNMTFDELIALCNERNPDWSKAETDFWAVSKQLHHPNTSYRSRGTYPQKSELFPKITAPMLILKADAEGELRQKNEEVAGLLPDGRIAHIKDAGHSVHRDELESFLNELNAFLRAL